MKPTWKLRRLVTTTNECQLIFYFVISWLIIQYFFSELIWFPARMVLISELEKHLLRSYWRRWERRRYSRALATVLKFIDHKMFKCVECGYKNVKHCKYKSKYQYTPVLLLVLYICTLYYLYNLRFTIVTCFRTKTNSL